MTTFRSARPFGDGLLAWFPFLVIFVMTPVNIYFTNQLDFGYEPKILLPFLGAALLLLFAMIGLCFLRGAWVSRLVDALFYLGLFLVLSDTLSPLRWGLMDGSEELREGGTSIAIQFALATILGLAWYAVPGSVVRAFGLPLVLVVVAWQVVTLGQILVREPTYAMASARGVPTTTSRIKNFPNIYQFVFDGYSSLLFAQTADLTNLSDNLRGFTFFRRNMSNYVVTDVSVPSFITGRLFKGGSLKDFQLQAKSGGLRYELQKLGYEISIYAPDRSRLWTYDAASHIYTSKEMNIGSDPWFRLVQTTAVRVAPEILKQESLVLANYILFGEKADYSIYKSQSVPLVERLIEDESGRPGRGQYVYAHLILPHAPYLWDGNCTLRQQTDIFEQTLCANKLIKDFIDKLKQLGRYDESLILIQSDHGWHQIHRTLLFTTPHVENDRYDTEEFSRRLHSLLLIKPPIAGPAPLFVSEEVSQLVDIPATVYDVLDLAPPPNDGHSVFALDEVRDREISVFGGIDADIGRSKLFGSSHATLGHFGYVPDRGWTVRPDLEATHEGW
jgi:hypothetical protein